MKFDESTNTGKNIGEYHMWKSILALLVNLCENIWECRWIFSIRQFSESEHDIKYSPIFVDWTNLEASIIHSAYNAEYQEYTNMLIHALLGSPIIIQCSPLFSEAMSTITKHSRTNMNKHQKIDASEHKHKCIQMNKNGTICSCSPWSSLLGT